MVERVRIILAAKLDEAVAAHPQAFFGVNGTDPEWPLWYAAYLLDDIRSLINPQLTQSELVYWLIAADKAFRSEQPDSAWTDF